MGVVGARVEPTDLPVEDAIGGLRVALADRGVAVLVAPPGAGKTTLVPLRLVDEDWLGGQRIVMLEPRRLAARAAAHRLADLLGEPIGRRVGYRTRDERVGGRDVRIEVVTEGILVRRLQHDPALTGTGLVILDEVHERNLTTDLSLALTLDARAGLRPDLRVLAMSATVDTGRFATVLGDGDGDGDDGHGGGDGPAPVIVSEGRQFPVARRWHPPEPRDRPDAHVARTVVAALRADPDGDVLVFLPGAAEIDRAVRAIRAAVDGAVAVLALHGSLPTAEQDRALAPSAPGRRRVVVATDIAESSLTVAGVRIVVDAGLARLPRFDPGTGLTRLVTEPASQAAADQRAGRAGRLGPGVVHRLWSEADHRRRPAFAPAEIETVDLAGFALELAAWGAAPADLALPEQPPARAWAEAQALLRDLGALDADGRPTATGRAMADLPLHPRLAHVVTSARERGAGWTGVVVAAVLDGRDLYRGRRDERPADLLDRVRAADGASVAEPVDGQAVASVRRRAKDLARRVRIDRAPLDPDAVGPLVAAAHPDRLAQARGGGGFRFRDGGGGRLHVADPLAGARFLAVAEVDAGGRGEGMIRTAVALDATDVERIVGDRREVVDELVWDDRGALRRRRTERAGALVLASVDGVPEPGPATVAALLDRVRADGLDALGWSDAALRLRARLAFLGRVRPDDGWPAVDDESLLADLDARLGPLVAGATRWRDVTALDPTTWLTGSLDWTARQALDRLAPERVDLPNGRRLRVAYDDVDRGPVASVRVPDLYGVTEHPTVGGRVPIVLELLSPANRPVQITSDLPGFWAGSWRDVRKDLAGRYPKHPWPADPSTAVPPPPRGRPRRA
jgi:ATP-dependent helicase HrpB